MKKLFLLALTAFAFIIPAQSAEKCSDIRSNRICYQYSDDCTWIKAQNACRAKCVNITDQETCVDNNEDCQWTNYQCTSKYSASVTRRRR